MGADAALETAMEVLRYAEEGLEKAIKTGDLLLYRNAAERARHAVTPPFVRGYRAPPCFLASSFARRLRLASA